MDTENYSPNATVQTAKPKKGGKGRNIEKIYQKKTQLEHILLRPDTYIGSVETITQPMWVWCAETDRMVHRPVSYVPGLYKIFDEIMVNAADNKQRDSSMNRLNVDVDVESGEIAVWNNGKGIPIVMHQEHNIYVPELIFGNLLTGSNFDDDEKKTTGGRNGYGAKLANVFSTEFTVETADSIEGKKYVQVFSKNMTEKSAPRISSSNKDYTRIAFKPDLARFKMTHLDEDIVALISKRAVDMAGVCGPGVKVYLNGRRVPINSFSAYVELYSPAPQEGQGVAPPSFKVMERLNDRWEVGVGISDGSFTQISFVNSISTSKGGQHVNAIADQVAARLIAVTKRKNKGVELKPAHIKNHLCVYVNALIENPAFDSQTKENMTTRPTQFGSSYQLSEKLLKAVEKSGIVDNILSWAKFKQTAELRRKTGGKKTKLVGIPKLDDANDAGGSKGHECTLILTEGDSAKALAVSGLGVVGRDKFGVFPLKGKLLNVREASHAQIMKNEEVQNIVKIMGLKFGEKYESTRSLRYGHLMIMTDQDHDGSHIKGLLINFIHHFWPTLLACEGFLQQFITPIVKVTKGKSSNVFYTLPEYEAWKEEGNGGSRGWNIKYYKGLGTSSAKEAKEYFSDLDLHRIDFSMEDAVDSDLIDMAFSKKRVEDRKTWLRGFLAGTHVDYGTEHMRYTDFINKELILFSIADNMRSIPSVMDGFKPSQRKVLFSCFKRKLKKEIKVAQLAGYVSEHSAYHHGEMSLNGTIIGMAQNFVGSNNMELLFPSGQFGTRLMGGKDAASPRYTFTRLDKITRLVFPLDDDYVLNYLDEDGQSIEPDFYLPVIPMVLVNGTDGIGTGWSSSVPNYNPQDLIDNVRRLLRGEEMEAIHPWYRGFDGTIVPKSGAKNAGSYVVSGSYERINDTTIRITELPVRAWTQPYKQFLETLLVGATGTDAGLVKDFKENHTDTTVSFTVTFVPEKLVEVEMTPGGLMKKMKLESSISTSNMMLFDGQSTITKYETPLEIISAFYSQRLELYGARKAFLVDKLGKEVCRLDNKVRFVLAVVNNELRVSNRKKAELMEEMRASGYDLILPDGGAKKVAAEDDSDDEGGEEEEQELGTTTASLSKGYDYLLSMKLWALTHERVEEMRATLADKQSELNALSSTTPEQLWEVDLDLLEVGLQESDADVQASIKESAKAVAAAKRAAAASKKGGKGKAVAAAARKRGGGGRKKQAHGDGGTSESEEESEGEWSDGSDYEEEKRPAKATTARGKAKAAGAGAAAAAKSNRAAVAPVAVPAPAVVAALTKSKGKGKAVAAKKTKPAPVAAAVGTPPRSGRGAADGSDSESEEVLSLAQRVANQMEITPGRAAAAAAARAKESRANAVTTGAGSKGKGKQSKKKVVEDTESEEEEVESESEGFDPSEEDEVEEVVPVAKSRAKKAGAGAATAAKGKKVTKAAPQAKAKPVAAKAPKPRAKAGARKGKNNNDAFDFDGGEEEEDAMDLASPVAAPSRAGRARAPVVYALDDSEEEEEEEEEEPSEVEAEEDDESDFEEVAPVVKAKPVARSAPKAKTVAKGKGKVAAVPVAAAATVGKTGRKRMKSPKQPAVPPANRGKASAGAGAAKGKAVATASVGESSPAVTPYPDKKKRKMKKVVSDSEDDEEEEEEEDIAVVHIKTPKPSRARAKVTYKQEESEAEEEEEGEDDDEEAVSGSDFDEGSEDDDDGDYSD